MIRTWIVAGVLALGGTSVMASGAPIGAPGKDTLKDDPGGERGGGNGGDRGGGRPGDNGDRFLP